VRPQLRLTAAPLLDLLHRRVAHLHDRRPVARVDEVLTLEGATDDVAALLALYAEDENLKRWQSGCRRR